MNFQSRLNRSLLQNISFSYCRNTTRRSTKVMKTVDISEKKGKKWLNYIVLYASSTDIKTSKKQKFPFCRTNLQKFKLKKKKKTFF